MHIFNPRRHYYYCLSWQMSLRLTINISSSLLPGKPCFHLEALSFWLKYVFSAVVLFSENLYFTLIFEGFFAGYRTINWHLFQSFTHVIPVIWSLLFLLRNWLLVLLLLIWRLCIFACLSSLDALCMWLSAFIMMCLEWFSWYLSFTYSFLNLGPGAFDEYKNPSVSIFFNHSSGSIHSLLCL